MIGLDVRDDMVPRVHTELAHVIELSSFARLNADARIGIRRAIMRLITGVLTALVARALALVLVLCPSLVTVLYRSQFLLIGTDSLLLFTGLVLFALSKQNFFVHGADMSNFQ